MATAAKVERKRATVTEAGDVGAGEDLLFVNVPKAFNYLDPISIMHKFEAGEQNMRRKFAEASYARANGVQILKDPKG